MRALLLAIFLFLPAPAQTGNVRELSRASVVNINETTNTPIYNQLSGANTFQIYIRPSSTAQNYVITLEDATTVEVPSGNTYTARFNIGINSGVRIFRVQTASSSAVLQVVAFKESR